MPKGDKFIGSISSLDLIKTVKLSEKRKLLPSETVNTSVILPVLHLHEDFTVKYLS